MVLITAQWIHVARRKKEDEPEILLKRGFGVSR